MTIYKASPKKYECFSPPISFSMRLEAFSQKNIRAELQLAHNKVEETQWPR